VTIKITVFLDVTPCSLVGIYVHLKETCCLYIVPLYSILKMEAAALFEAFVPMKHTT
jgi:hypothetical protein